jgi:flavoprotein
MTCEQCSAEATHRIICANGKVLLVCKGCTRCAEEDVHFTTGSETWTVTRLSRGVVRVETVQA